MAERSMPWDFTIGLGDKGPYGFAQEAARFRSQVMSGTYGNVYGGICYGFEEDLRVSPTTPASNQVTLNKGAAVVYGFHYENTADLNFTVPANGTGVTRQDILGLAATWATQQVRAFYRTGGVNPPALTQNPGVLVEIPLAHIAAPNGFATIDDDDIYDGTMGAHSAFSPPRIAFEVAAENYTGASTPYPGSVAYVDPSGQFTVTETSATPLTPIGIVEGSWGSGFRVVPVGLVNVHVNLGQTPAPGLPVSIRPVGLANVYVGYDTDASSAFGVIVATTGYPATHPLCFVNFLARNGSASPQVAIFSEEQANNTAGGAFNNGAWRTRALNTTRTLATQYSFIQSAALAANQITLPYGYYRMSGYATAFDVDGHRLRWYNITSAASVAEGVQACCGAADTTMSIATIECEFEVGAATEVFELQHQCQTTKAGDGFGFALNFGTNEVYALVKIEKLW